jgi:hypothetical protein
MPSLNDRNRCLDGFAANRNAVVSFSSAWARSDYADEFASRWDSRMERQPRRGDIFVEIKSNKVSSSVRSGICRPDGAGEWGGAGGYKDFAPDGATH